MRISKDVFHFLSELKANNSREWFQENKYRHDEINNSVKDFIGNLIFELARIDPHIHADISAAKCMFRIYRDIRFSKDKTPYKTWYSAGISIDGRKLEGPEYYFHIEPAASFIAAGYWRPQKGHLALIRQEIDYNYRELEEALLKGGFSVEELSHEDKLKRAPAGYTEDDPNIELLKLKSFILYQPLSDEEVLSSEALRIITERCKRMLPFKVFIHQALDQ